ncbi:MAG: TolC family protein [Sandaracinaceae bacterium]
MDAGRIVLAAVVAAFIGVPAHVAAQERDSYGAVSLEALLRHAETRAPAMVVARSRLGLVREEEGAAESPFPANPRAMVAAGPRFDDSGAADVDVTVQLWQPIEIAGEQGERQRVTRARRERLSSELEAVRWDVHRQLHATFHLALLAREQVEVSQLVVEFQERMLDVARRRVASGDASPLIEPIAQVEVAQARQMQIAARGRYRVLQVRLAEIAGWSTSTPPAPAGQLGAPRALPALERLVEIAREHQPRLAALRAAVGESRARVSLAHRDAWPEPTLGVGFAREGAPNGTPDWIVTGRLMLPLPFWQRNQAGIGREEGRLDVAEAQRDAAELVLPARVARLAVEVSTSAEQVQVYQEDVLPRFEQNLELLARAFELGEIDLMRLSLARERLLSARLAALDVQAAYYRALAELEAFMGAHPWAREEHHGAGS